MFKKSLSLAFLSLFFSSCVSMAPNLDLNKNSVIPENFKNYEVAKDKNSSNFEFVINEELKKILNRALENNKDLQIALLRVEESKSLYRIEESNLYPKIDASGTFNREKKDETIKNNYKAGVGTVFELDLFGKNRSLNDAARNSFFATQYALNSTKLTLISQTVNSYLSLASNIENLNLQKSLNENLNSVYELTNKKYSAGVISKEDVLSSFAVLKESQNELLNYENLVQIDINSLEVLLGETLPEDLIPKELKKDNNYIALLNSEINSNILLNRPDIKELEYKLRSKNANIGAARAAFFPSISLTANTGFASSSLDNLFRGSNSFWQISPSINIPIFSAGENSAKLDLSETQKDIALKEYEKGIQTAFKEVNDSLIIRKNIYSKLQNQKELSLSVEEAYTIALNSYKIGYGSYLNMLIAQKAYINSQKTLIKTYLEELENRVEIFKSLGGVYE
ncbi:RND transporter [Aliarcobacter trophiarum LMG 25534]|uniref:RND family efflux system, outer membrane channel protein, TolC family n=1 Tax=Aliarcobacter trophiarum LMG 25534 TaxID=1032241 RepID=A0AAD0QMC9_9BACT|nr:TolC family protein [Aliarcobacter trophiarum]AXK49761.1 RND family efflux system, outer membrane channel protein, TolC family [Aliarcobacter trophiarum LMG 25534]RXI28083.1 RND transporter [Aliarcobacter trophiarum]RXJ92463.1 RND transporter [Aliarcobacter trophiarum LMG 25534]